MGWNCLTECSKRCITRMPIGFLRSSKGQIEMPRTSRNAIATVGFFGLMGTAAGLLPFSGSQNRTTGAGAGPIPTAPQKSVLRVDISEQGVVVHTSTADFTL